MYVLLLSSMLACSISASPLIYDGVQPRAQAPSVPNAILAQSNLSSSSPPWGPPEFEVNFDLPPRRQNLQQEACFMNAVQMVSELAAGDFEEHLPEPRQFWRLPQYPRMAISVAKAENMQNLRRKFVLWGMARAMNQFITNGRFEAAIFELVWRGVNVGSILFLGGTPGLDTEPTLGNVTGNMTETTNATSTSVTLDNLTWDFELFGDQLGLQSISMGAIGALIEAAEHTAHNFDHFVGSFGPDSAIWVFIASARPTSFSKSLLVASINAAVRYAVRHQDYRQNRFGIKLDGVEIARGATDLFPAPPGLSAGVGTNLTTS